MAQLAIPSALDLALVVRKRSLGAVMELSMDTAGLTPKQVQAALHADKAQCSRWFADAEGIVWAKLQAFMDVTGSHAPVLWMLHQLGYDLASLRRQESELERELRLAHERIAGLLLERAAERSLLAEVLTGRGGEAPH